MATKTIQEQIAEMENRCAKLEELQKLFEKAVKNECCIEVKKIHKILENSNEKSSDFDCQYKSGSNCFYGTFAGKDPGCC